MEYGSVLERIILAVAIIGILLVFAIFRPKNPKRERVEIVGMLLEENRLNMVLTDTFETRPQQWPFRVTGWQLHRKKLDFLDEELRKDIDTSYNIEIDFNQRLKATRKAKAVKREPVDLATLKECLPKMKRGLEDWLLANHGSIDQYLKPPGVTDWLFGRK